MEWGVGQGSVEWRCGYPASSRSAPLSRSMTAEKNRGGTSPHMMTPLADSKKSIPAAIAPRTST